MTISVEEATAMLTAPGQPFELEEAVVRGTRLHVWKNTPPNGRALLEATRAHGDRAFVVFGDERLSFAEHFGQAATLAHRLVDVYGVRKGDRVAIAMRNLPEWIVAFWGALSAGAIVVPLNGWWTGHELDYGLEDSGSKILIADPERLARLADDLPGLHLESIIVARGQASGPGQVRWEDVLGTGPWAESLPDVPIDPGDDATILYTSGTTGQPKGAVATHRNLCTSVLNAAFSGARSIVQFTGALPGSSVIPASAPMLVGAPLFHVTGLLAQMVPAVVFGGTLVLMPKWNAELALELIERERVGTITGVPAMIWQILESPDFDKRDTSSLLVAGYGGAAAPPELFRRAHHLLPSVASVTGYGITETSSAISGIAGADYEARPDSVGVAVPTCEVKAVDGECNEVPRGELGEFWIKGPNVVKGYWNRPDDTAESFTDGWFHTGDIGRMDDQGFLYIVDRAKDMIIRGGENVYSVEVEAALYDHPAVTECAVIGIPHRVLGEEVGAVVRFREGASATEQELQDHVRERLAAFKVPVRIWVHDQPLPKNAAGKMLKRELRDQVLGATAANEQTSKRLRELSGYERALDWLEHEKGACHIVRVVEFDGSVDPTLMERAFHRLVQRRPLLCTTIVREDERAWFETCEQPAEFEVLPRGHDQAWRDEFQRQMETPVMAEGGPPIRLRLLTGDGRGGELVLSCHHSVCDGRSITQFCGDLVYEYESLLGRRAPSHVERVGQVPAPMEELLPERLQGDAYEGLARAYMIERMQLVQGKPPWLMTPHGQGTPTPALMRYRLEPDEFAQLRALGHTHGATMQGAVTAALLRSAVNLAGDEDAEIGLLSSLDLRSHLSHEVPLTDLGVYAGSIIDIHRGITSSPFWTLARKATERIHEALNGVEPYLSMTTLGMVNKQVLTGGARPPWPQFIFSNLGRLDVPADTSLRVRSIHGGTNVQGVGPNLYCTAVGTAGSLYLDVVFQQPDVSRADAERYGSGIIEHLRSAAGAPAVATG